LDHPLEAGCGLGILQPVSHQIRQFIIDIVNQRLLKLLRRDGTSFENGERVLVFHQGKQKVLKRRIFLAALVCECQRPMQSALKTVCKTGQGMLHSGGPAG